MSRTRRLQTVRLCVRVTVPPGYCRYYVNRDTLFLYHTASETFLQRLMSIYVSAHYKNTPNDLQLLADAPGHHVFVKDDTKLPNVLVVLQVRVLCKCA